MEDNAFVTLKFKEKTAAQFRKFSREMGKQQTETLQLMLDFFTEHCLSPSENLGPNMKSLEGRLNKRISGVISIIRNIEKTQTKPILAMLQLLFQEEPEKKKNVLLEKNPASLNPTVNPDLQQANLNLKQKMILTRTDINMLLEKVVVTRNNFGKIYLRLNIDPEEFKKLQLKYKT